MSTSFPQAGSKLKKVKITARVFRPESIDVLDYDIKKCTRRCAATDRELHPGDVFFSVLVVDEGTTVRHDYCERAWEGPPANAIAWWKSRIPDPHAKRVDWAPNDVMLHYFEELFERPQCQDICYILALLLIRRRILRLDATEHEEGKPQEFILYCPRNETEYRIPVVTPDRERIDEIQDELARLLFGNAS